MRLRFDGGAGSTNLTLRAVEVLTLLMLSSLLKLVAECML